MAAALSDIRLALRAWRKSPTFAVVAIVSIGLGIGLTTAIFTLVDQVLLRTLPVTEPHQLVQVTVEGTGWGNSRGDGTELSYPTYAALRDENQVFSGMFSQVAFPLQVGESVQPERVFG